MLRLIFEPGKISSVYTYKNGRVGVKVDGREVFSAAWFQVFLF